MPTVRRTAPSGTLGRGSWCSGGQGLPWKPAQLGGETRHCRQLSTKEKLCVGIYGRMKAHHAVICGLVSLPGLFVGFEADPHVPG